MTSKLQVTIPKAIADQYAIEPGQEIDWLEAGDAIRIVPQSARTRRADRALRLELFDAATGRQLARQRGIAPATAGGDRGWTREELYERGRAR